MPTPEMTLDHVRGIVIGAAALALLLCVMLWPGCSSDAPDSPDSGPGALEPPAGPTTIRRGVTRRPPDVEVPSGAKPTSETGPDTETGLRVTGRVLDAHGRPVAHMPVRFSLTPDAGRHGESPSERYTDADGRYVIDGLRVGKLWMSMLSERSFGESQEREFRLTKSAEVDFTVAGAIVLGGRVEAPVAGPVELWLDYHEEIAGGGWSAVWGVRRLTLAAGENFRLAALRPGVYTLHVKSEGAEEVERELQLFANEESLVVRLSAGFALTGRITVDKGLDPAGSVLWIYPESADWQRRIQADSEGRFREERLPSGAYRAFLRNTTETEDESIETERRFTVRIDGADRTLDLHLARDEPVVLSATLPQGVESAEGVIVHLDGPEGPGREQEFSVWRTPEGDTRLGGKREVMLRYPPVKAVTDDGELLVHGLPAGRHRIRIDVRGFESIERELDVDAGRTTPLRLEVDLIPDRSSRRVTSSVASTYWRVESRRAGSGDPWALLLWEDGRILITHRATPGVREALLPIGAYDFRVVSDERAEARRDGVAVTEGVEPLRLDFDLPPGVTLAGAFGEHDEESGPGGLIHVFRDRRGAWSRLEEKETNARDGRYRIRGLSPGRYRLSLSETAEPSLLDVEIGTEDVTRDL